MWGREEDWFLKGSAKGSLHRQDVPREQTARGAILRGPESGGVGELPVWEEGEGARSTEGRTEGEAARRTAGRADGE